MFLKDLLNIGSLDWQAIENYYRIIAEDFSFANLADIPCGQLDANCILSELFYAINQAVFSHLKIALEAGDIALAKPRWRRRLIRLCDERLNAFCPFINCIDSWFQNELDQVTLENRSIAEISEAVLPLLLDNFEN